MRNAVLLLRHQQKAKPNIHMGSCRNQGPRGQWTTNQRKEAAPSSVAPQNCGRDTEALHKQAWICMGRNAPNTPTHQLLSSSSHSQAAAARHSRWASAHHKASARQPVPKHPHASSGAGKALLSAAGNSACCTPGSPKNGCDSASRASSPELYGSTWLFSLHRNEGHRAW